METNHYSEQGVKEPDVIEIINQKILGEKTFENKRNEAGVENENRFSRIKNQWRKEL